MTSSALDYILALTNNESEHHNGTSSSHSFLGLEGSAAQGLASSLTVACVLGAGLASGLNLCLLSLDPAAVEATSTSPSADPTTRARAKRVSAILEHQHWMLVTTLIWNALFVESLPLMLQPLIDNAILVVAISTISVLIFGEIIPQSFFTRYALAVASFLSPVVWALMLLSSPLSVPIAKLLDCILGHRPQMAMKRVELRELISLNAMAAFASGEEQRSHHYGTDEESGLLDNAGGGPPEQRLSRARNAIKDRQDNNNDPSAAYYSDADEDGEDGAGRKKQQQKKQQQNQQHALAPSSSSDDHLHRFTADETALLNGALNLSEKTVRDAMHPNELIDKLYMLEESQVLTREVVAEISKVNKTRIPVYQHDRRNIIGFIFSHSILHIIFMKEDKAPRVKECGVTAAARCNASDLVVVLFRPFLSDAQDIAVVHDDASGLPIGIVTKWDMLSFLFNDEIRAEKWSPHEAEMLAMHMQKAQRHSRQRANMVRTSTAVSPTLKHVTNSSDSIGGGAGDVGASHLTATSGNNSFDQKREMRLSNAAAAGGGGHYGSTADRASSSQPAQRSASSYVGAGGGSVRVSVGGRRASHYVPGDAQRQRPSFAGTKPQ